MTEFQGMPKEKLQMLKMNLESYKQGVIDTWKIFEDIFEKTINLYDQKIKMCENEIIKDSK